MKNRYKYGIIATVGLGIALMGWRVSTQRTPQVLFAVLPHFVIQPNKLDTRWTTLQEHVGSGKLTILIISPDHFNDTTNNQQTYKALSGIACFQGDCVHISGIFTAKNTKVATPLFTSEHGWGAQFRFINRHFPQAEVILLKIPSRKIESLDQLSQKIQKIPYSSKLLVLASVDFSHYVSENFAQIHDRTSRYTLNNSITYQDYTSLDVDCPNCLFLVNNRATSLHQYPHLMQRDSSSSLVKKDLGTNNTSRQFILYMTGKSLDQGITLGFFGDLIFDRGVAQHLSTQQALTDHFSDWFQQNDTSKSPQTNFHRKGTSIDLLGRNLETPVITSGASCQFSTKKSINFCSLDRFLPLMHQLGRNIANIANNHSFDADQQGYQNTQKILQNNAITPFGNDLVATKTIRGIPVALHGYNELESTSGDNQKYCTSLQTYKQSGYKNILTLHRGIEYQTKHNIFQERLAKYFIDCGADIIIGHHPHVIQDIQRYKDKPIIYSLGNFLFDQYTIAETGMYLLADIPLSGKIQIRTGEIKSVP